MKVGLILALGIACLASLATLSYADEKPAPVTFTAGALHLCMDDVYFTQKKGYVHVLFDILPYAAQIRATHLTSLSTVAQALIKDQGLKQFSKEKKFKIDVVEILARDDYGAPRWDQIKLKESYLGEAKGKDVILTPKGAAK
jgi:hypothetical protein